MSKSLSERVDVTIFFQIMQFQAYTPGSSSSPHGIRVMEHRPD